MVHYQTGDDPAQQSYCIYTIRQSHSTQHGCKYDWTSSELEDHPGMHYASVGMHTKTCTIMHSYTPMVAKSKPPVTFQEKLESCGNSSLWDHLSYDGDREWIREVLSNGTVCVAHDGSFMAERSTQHCSAGIIIYCTKSRQCLKSAMAETSDSASNYRGELLGVVMALLILRAASIDLIPQYPQITLHCNNRGVLSHGNSPRTSLPEKQKQADLIRLIKTLCLSSNLRPA